MTTIGVDSPAILAAQRAHKHAKRIPFVCRPDAALPPLAQWEAKVRSIALWAEPRDGECQRCGHPLELHKDGICQSLGCGYYPCDWPYPDEPNDVATV